MLPTIATTQGATRCARGSPRRCPCTRQDRGVCPDAPGSQEGRNAVRPPEAYPAARPVETAGPARGSLRVHPGGHRPEPAASRQTDCSPTAARNGQVRCVRRPLCCSRVPRLGEGVTAAAPNGAGRRAGARQTCTGAKSKPSPHSPTTSATISDHWRTTTFIAALRRDGLDAPMTLDGPMNGEIFRAWTEQFLAPALKPGDIVIMDNLPSHKVCGIRQTIEAVRARLIYLPPYSPDLNPIEQVFAKFKAALRKAAARTVTRLWQEIAKTLNTFSPQECAAYLIHCGYAN